MGIIEKWMTEIIVALLTTVTIFSFRNYIIPFVLGCIQRAVDVSGVWTGFDIDEQGKETQRSVMTIKQIGSKINASVIRNTDSGEKRKSIYKGKVSNGQVLLIWHEEKCSGYNMGTLTLGLSESLLELKGYITHLNRDNGKVISKGKIYKKIK